MNSIPSFYLSLTLPFSLLPKTNIPFFLSIFLTASNKRITNHLVDSLVVMGFASLMPSDSSPVVANIMTTEGLHGC